MCGSTYCMINPLRSGEPPDASSRVDPTSRLLETATACNSLKLKLMVRRMIQRHAATRLCRDSDDADRKPLDRSLLARRPGRLSEFEVVAPVPIVLEREDQLNRLGAARV